MGTVGQSPFHLPTCLWKCESLPDCENPPRPALPMFRGSGEAKASPQYPHWHLGTFTGIWEHSQGGKHCWGHQTSIFQLPALMLEGSGCSGAGGQSGGTTSSQVCLWKRWESLVITDSGSLKSNGA